jgi:hypothetical protein
MGMSVPALLEVPGAPSDIETVAIENISLHGARVLGSQPFRIDEDVVVTDVVGGLRLTGRVVYCQSLTDGRYAVGLHFDDSFV